MTHKKKKMTSSSFLGSNGVGGIIMNQLSSGKTNQICGHEGSRDDELCAVAHQICCVIANSIS